jgi:PiT family inorganic phosphate transporter
MPDFALGYLIIIVIFAVGFGLVNGFNDAANAIGASVGSRSISPRNAVMLAACFNFVGAATGLEVARTIGKGILVPEAISYVTVIAALASVIIWGSVATYWGLPVSITHGFVSGPRGRPRWAWMPYSGALWGGYYPRWWRLPSSVLSAALSS